LIETLYILACLDHLVQQALVVGCELIAFGYQVFDLLGGFFLKGSRGPGGAG
jgi:hypothetical protein